MSLTRRESDEVSSVRRELPQEAWRLLHVDQGVVGKDVEEEAAGRADGPAVAVASEAAAGRRSAVEFSGQQPEGHVLRRDLPGNEAVSEDRLGVGHLGSLSRGHF